MAKRYLCENDCGFSGGFHAVAAHEKTCTPAAAAAARKNRSGATGRTAVVKPLSTSAGDANRSDSSGRSQRRPEAESVLSQEKMTELYGGADGILDEQELVMMKYDTDCSGSFSIAEVKAIINDLEHAHSLARNMGRALTAVTVGFLVFCGVQAGIMYSMNEASKESRVVGQGASQMMMANGQVVATAEATYTRSLADLLTLSVDEAKGIKTLSFTTATDADACDNADPATHHSHIFHVANINFEGSDSATVWSTSGAAVVQISPGAAVFTERAAVVGSVVSTRAICEGEAASHRRQLSAGQLHEVHARRLDEDAAMEASQREGI